MADQLELPQPPEGSEPPEELETSDEPEASEPSDVRDEAALAIAARHALHDEELVAALAGDALEGDEVGRASALVERCPACRDLHRDLVATAFAHRATAVLTLAAPRDFRLTEADAARLRPDVPLIPKPEPVAVAAAGAASGRGTTLPGRVRASFWSAARPIGGALAAAGLVGVLIGSVGLAGLPASAPLSFGGDRQEGMAPQATDGTAASVDHGAPGEGAGRFAVDSRLLLVGASVAVGLTGLMLLATGRRRARESI